MTDYLPGTNFIIEQEDNLYHMNGDSVLLGQSLHVTARDRVLDIGCNQGVLLLYASLGNPKELVGVDVFEEVIESARKNLERNHVSAKLYTTRIQDFKDEQYSLIVCNPPYFKGDYQKENPYIKAARSQTSLPLDDLFSAVARLLSDKGRFCMIYPSKYLNELLYYAHQYQLGLKEMHMEKDAKTNQKGVVLYTFSHGLFTETTIV